MADAPAPPQGSPAIRVSTMPADANAYGDIFGGWRVGQMDLAAGLVASRRARGRAVTIAMDGIQFLAPVFVGDEVSVYADLRKVGRTSMIIDVQAWRRDRTGEAMEKVTEACFTFVAIDEARRPRPVDASA